MNRKRNAIFFLIISVACYLIAFMPLFTLPDILFYMSGIAGGVLGFIFLLATKIKSFRKVWSESGYVKSIGKFSYYLSFFAPLLLMLLSILFYFFLKQQHRPEAMCAVHGVTGFIVYLVARALAFDTASIKRAW